MLRLLGFFVLVLVILGLARSLLGGVPVLGPLLHVPLLVFWIVAALLSLAATRFAAASIDRQKQRALERSLGVVDTPHNQGKLGSLLLQQGRASAALPSLERAAEGEPEVAEWAYRLGLARIGAGKPQEGLAALKRALSLDAGVGFGEPLMRGAETLAGLGHHEDALEWLTRFERNHGPSPEWAYRQGRAQARLGRKDAARSSFERVAEIANEGASYQRGGAALWIARARWARWFA